MNVTESGSARPRADGRRESRIWLWVFAAFALQFLVWGAWLVFARYHPVEEIPVATPTAE